MKLGPVGPFVHRYRKWIMWAVLAAGALTLALWSYPTGLVVFWLVVIVLVALALVRFLDQGELPSADEPPPTDEPPPADTGPEALKGS
jgi:hypothetical protein